MIFQIYLTHNNNKLSFCKIKLVILNLINDFKESKQQILPDSQ